MGGFKDRYCFIHLPKCAGTSVLHFLQAALGESNVLHVHTLGVHRPPIEDLISRYKILVGHYEVSNLPAWMFDYVFMFTFLRDPVDRVLSNYDFFRNVDHGTNFPEVVRARELDLALLLARTDLSRPNVWSNWQTFALSGLSHRAFKPGTILEPAKRILDRLDFVGFHEQLNADVKRLSELCGWDPTIPLPAANVTPNRKGRAEVDATTLASIEELNRDDIELYEYAKTLLPKPRSLVPTSDPEEVPWLSNLPANAHARVERGPTEIAIKEVVVREGASNSPSIQQGAQMEIKIAGESTIACTDFVAGIRITDPRGAEIYATNTLLMDGPMILQPGEKFSVVFSCETNLAPDIYYLTVAFHTVDDREFHWIENHSFFACVAAANRTFSGRMDLKAKVTKTSAPNG